MAKSAIDDLAIFGGEPAFAETLHVGRPNIGDRERLLARLEDILDRNWLTNGGRYVGELEARIAEEVGVKHCVATANGTVALELAIRALGLAGEVIVPSFTFVATAHALAWQGVQPVFCDIETERFTLDPEQVERHLTPRTSGILAVHLWGRPAQTEALARLAERHGLRLLFDASHAFGCSSGGRMIGGFGEAEVFSFHATKVVNSFEGGAVVTDDAALAAKVRRMKNFGFTGLDRVESIGINGKMPEISAAMGLTSLESKAAIFAHNRRNYEAYGDNLRDLPGVRLLTFDARERCNYHYLTIDIEDSPAGLGRDELLQVLQAEGVAARRYFYPGCHNMEPYRSQRRARADELPNTERFMRRLLCLPTGCAIDEATIARLCAIIRLAVARGPEVSRRLRARVSVPAAREPLRFGT